MPLDDSWRLAEDIGPNEQVAVPDDRLEDSHVGPGWGDELAVADGVQ